MLMKTPARLALYGRHSTAMQTATSSADQAVSCLKLVDYLGGTVVATYQVPNSRVIVGTGLASSNYCTTSKGARST